MVNFFRVIREDESGLINALQRTPFSREEFVVACSEALTTISDLERARRFFVRAQQVRTGLGQTASPGRWANCKDTSRGSMSGSVSRWLNSVQSLNEVTSRLLRVQIENRPALEVIRLYDGPETLFYVDPPYAHESRRDSSAYGFEMTDEDHRRLAETLAGARGMVAVSGYRCGLLDELYSTWRRIDGPVKTAHSCRAPRQESLWMNY